MQSLIAEAIREITEQLSGAWEDPTDLRPEPPSSERVLDTSSAEFVNNRSFVFPNPDGDADFDWCVLALDKAGRSDNYQICRLRGRLRGGMKPEAFVEKAYELIFIRSLDEAGRSIYPDLLEKQVLTKRDFLRILAASSEARDIEARLVIVPEPSSWLSNLGVVPGDDPSFPALLVQVRE